MIQIRTNKNLLHVICYENGVDVTFFFSFNFFLKACDKLVNNNEYIKTTHDYIIVISSASRDPLKKKKKTNHNFKIFTR